MIYLIFIISIGSVAGVSLGVRERCDSLPSRANFIPSNISLGNTVRPTSNSISSHQRQLGSVLRPHSIHAHNISHSPPVIMNTPLSPHTGILQLFHLL